MKGNTESATAGLLTNQAERVRPRIVSGPVPIDGFQPTVQFNPRPPRPRSPLYGLNTAERRVVPPGFEGLLDGISLPPIPGLSFSPGLYPPDPFRLRLGGGYPKDSAGGANVVRPFIPPSEGGGGGTPDIPDYLRRAHTVIVRNNDPSQTTWTNATLGSINTDAPLFSASLPAFDGESDPPKRKYVIPIQDIPFGQTGRAVVLGVTPLILLVNDPSHRWATKNPDVPWLAESSETETPIQILWLDDNPSPVRSAWCLVGPQRTMSAPTGLAVGVIVGATQIDDDEFEYRCRPIVPIVPDPDTGEIDARSRSWIVDTDPDVPDMTAYNPFERVPFVGYTSRSLAVGIGVTLLSYSIGGEIFYYIMGLANVEGLCNGA